MRGDDRTVEDDMRPTGWHADPFGRHEQRWWDGAGWSEKIRTRNKPGIDPIGIDTAPVAIADQIPAEPIVDALLPIKKPRIADKLAMFVACLVFLALVAVFVVAMTA